MPDPAFDPEPTDPPPGPAPRFAYPVVLDLAGRDCLVVGGGRVARAKVAGLLAAGARVTVVAPALDPGLAALAEAPPPGSVAFVRRAYREGDVVGRHFVVTATGDPATDAAVAAAAEAAGVLVNAADDPAHCTAILPAVHRAGPVTVAVSTGGASPALATFVRDTLAAALPGALGEAAALLAEARAALVARGRPTSSVDWRALLEGPFLARLEAGDTAGARKLLAEALAQAEVAD